MVGVDLPEPPRMSQKAMGKRRMVLGLSKMFMPALVTVAILALLVGVDARSSKQPPLRRLHHPSRSSLQILPRISAYRSPYSRARSLLSSPHPSSLRHSDTFFLSLSLPSVLPHPAHLLLKPTEHLLHPDAKISYSDGSSEPLRKEDWRVFTGEVISDKWAERVKWEEMNGLRDPRTDERAIIGSARIMVHYLVNDEPVFEGVFTVAGQNYHVLTGEHYARVKTDEDIDVVDDLGRMVVFRDQDAYHDDGARHEYHMCSHDSLAFNTDPFHPVRVNGQLRFGSSGNSSLYRRDDIGGMTGSSNFINSIGNPSGCPSTQQVVYMGVALDCNYIRTYGSASAARTQVLNDWNQISALYRSTFNISLGIVELVVQNITCPDSAVAGAEWDVSCESNLSLDDRLSSFSQWRGNKGDDGVGLWHLMSACPTDTEVGVAWLGTLCQTTSTRQGASYVSGTGISTATKTEWSLISHEIGHGFGAIHDCTSGCSLSGTCCPLSPSTCDASGQFIMNPTTSTTEEQFSPCTLGNICSGLGSRIVSSSCIQSPGARTVLSLQQCGNGIVDDGEDCDPGENGDSTCCDPQTCKFRSGAVCDPSNSACCTSQCQYASAGTVCRPAVDATCDYAETCTGTNATCPKDVTAGDGTSCGSDGLSCAGGRCTSLDRQCQTAGSSMGLTTTCGQRDDTSCVVSCRDPRTPNQCVVLQTPLVDGSPCGYGGHCYNQTCGSGPWQDTAAAWYKSNLQISVPVTVIAGLIALGILVLILRCCFRGCMTRKSQANQLAAQQQNRQSLRQSRFMGPSVTPTNVPPPVHRHSASVSSQDGMMRTGVMTRETSPGSRTGSAYGEYATVPNTSPPRNHGYGDHLHPQGGGGYGYSAQPPFPPGGYHGGYQQGYGAPSQGYDHNPYESRGGAYGARQQGWVDERTFNGPSWGGNEAYGRR